ncbi:MAG: septum formation inhibitor Maf [Deltaproteobacteria bacterium]|jgi:septum formation protein|nr:septum formation inhibitor Maf [Deltaproteobacteria bacterium]
MSSAPFKTVSRLILASASPRRKALLNDIGLDFEVMESRVEEIPAPGESPRDFVIRAACDKASDISRANNQAWVLGADTVVVHDDRILGKPRDAEDALSVLLSLAGRKHLVHTGFCLKNYNKSVSVSRVVTTEVKFSPFSRDIAAAYVATGEPLDKAGAYGIQGIGTFLVERVNGSYTNVVGLPLVEVLEELLGHKVVKPRTE